MESTSNSPTPNESESSSSASTPVPPQSDTSTDQFTGASTTPSLTASEPTVIQPSATSATPATPEAVAPTTTVTPATFTPETPPADTSTTPATATPLAVAQPSGFTEPKPVAARSKLLLAGLGLVVLVGACFGSYLLGKHAAKPAAMKTSAQQTAMTVPKDATVIEQCSPGFGTQYVLPKDIPGGPVYNVYQGKLIGIEYMTALTSASNPDLMLKDLPLYAQKYDHVDIMTMPAHAGFPKPHYQVDVMMVPTAVSSKITCDSASSGSSTNSSMNTTSNTTNSSMSNMSM